MQRYAILLSLLLFTIFSLCVSISLAQPEIVFKAKNHEISRYLVNFDQPEQQNNEVYRWSSPQAAFLLDGFWGWPVILNVRLNPARPTSLSPVFLKLGRSPAQENVFRLENGWRRYQMLLLPLDSASQKVWFEVSPFIPGKQDRRKLGIAVSDFKATLPLHSGWRIPEKHQIAYTFPLPLLIYIIISHFMHGLTKLKSFYLSISILFSLLTLGLVCLALNFPSQWMITIPMLWGILGIRAISIIPGQISAKMVFALVTFIYLLLTLFLPLPNGMLITNGDEPHYLIQVFSILHDRDFDLSNNYQNKDYHEFYDGWELIPHLDHFKGRVISHHPFIGLALIILPGYLLGARIGVLITLNLSLALAVTWLYKINQTYAPPKIALFTTLFAAFTYPLVIYSQQIYPEALAFTLVTFVLLQSLAPSGCYPRLQAFTVGGALALLPHLHPKMALLAATLFLFFLWQTRQSFKLVLGWVMGPILLLTALFFAWIYALYGEISLQIFLTPAQGKLLDSRFGVHGLFGLFFDQEFGLFFWSPFYLLAFVGLRRFWLNKQTRIEAWFFILIYGTYHLLNGLYWDWNGGVSPVPRYLIPILPLLIILTTLGLAELWQRKELIRPLILGSASYVITFLVCQDRLLMFGYETGKNSILQKYQLYSVIQWLPSFKRGLKGEAYLHFALLLLGLLIFWHGGQFLERKVYKLIKR